MISSVKYYACGYCVNKMKFIVKNPVTKTKAFYAGAFLIKHEKYGNILYDTGYSTDIYKCGLVGKLYNMLNPTYVKEEDTIVSKLKEDNIKTTDIDYVILSHLHPDHIGCVKDFTNAKIIISKKSLDEYKKGNIRSLIFKQMLPDNFEEIVDTVDKFEKNEELFYGNDIFDDDSLILTQIDGHSNGQLGLYIKEHNIFLGADAAWGMEFVEKSDEMSIFAKLVQNNFSEFAKCLELLKKLRDSGVQIYLSHDDCNKKELTNE